MIKKQKLLTLVVFILSSIFLMLCTNPTEPKETLLPEKEYEPGTRNYVWKIDTLNSSYPFNYYYRLWGYSQDEVWIIGSGGEEDRQFLIYQNDSIRNFIDGDYTTAPLSIFGTAQNNIWVGCDAFVVKNYNGVNYYTYTLNKPELYP